MMSNVPTVYILHGDDQLAARQFIATLQIRMGDESFAEMNTTRLDGKAFQIDELANAIHSLPFSVQRRLVWLHNLDTAAQSKNRQEQLLRLFEGIPQSTALVISVPIALEKKDWLLKWAEVNKERTFIRQLQQPVGKAMSQWLQEQVAELNGAISNDAADYLADLIENDTQLGMQEINKLLAYVNYERQIEVKDVEAIVAILPRGDYFTMVDALVAGESSSAMEMLTSLLEEREATQLYFGIIDHYRLLLQTREIFENNGNEHAVQKTLSIHPYRAKKLFAQSRKFTLESLEKIHQKFVTVDLKIKTGEYSYEHALEHLVATLTN
jgi:DNA polymerase-3 subunit delta